MRLSKLVHFVTISFRHTTANVELTAVSMALAPDHGSSLPATDTARTFSGLTGGRPLIGRQQPAQALIGRLSPSRA